MKTKVLVVVMVMAVLVAFAGPAPACTIGGHVVFSGISGSTAVYYVAPANSFGLIPYVFSYITTNLAFMDMMNNALADNRFVTVTSSVSCPTSGTIRAGGSLTSVAVRPLY